MKSILLYFAVFSLFAFTALAQDPDLSGTGTGGPSTSHARKTKGLRSPEPAKSTDTATPVEESGNGKRWSFYVTISGLADSNINQDQDDISDYGLVTGAGLYFRNRAENPNFEFNYEIGRHAYRSTDRWDRTSHYFKVRSENRLGKRWVSETDGEISLKGSTEDRELTDRYSLTQFFQYRLNRSHRLNLGGSYRLKRYASAESERDSKNPYVEGGYETLFGNSKRKLEFSYRYEWNVARNERFNYIRRTYAAKFKTPLFRKGRLEIDARYRPQKYARFVDVALNSGDEIRVPRLDKRWILASEWRRTLGHGLELGLIYKYERRLSNDTEKNFTSNSLGIVMTYRWWN